MSKRINGPMPIELRMGSGGSGSVIRDGLPIARMPLRAPANALLDTRFRARPRCLGPGRSHVSEGCFRTGSRDPSDAVHAANGMA
jgi:hypothetical protein